MPIRLATTADLPRIVEIYNAAIPGRLATADLTPVSVESRRAWFEAHKPESHPLLVMTNDSGAIMGWGSVSVFYGRIAYQHTAEISVYIAPEFSRKGVGKALTQEIIQRCPSLRIYTLLAYIFGHNEPSVALFEKFGFVKWGHLPNIAELDGIERDLVIYGLRISPSGNSAK
jgi:L-amino acid N-acyltransferase YncA